MKRYDFKKKINENDFFFTKKIFNYQTFVIGDHSSFVANCLENSVSIIIFFIESK